MVQTDAGCHDWKQTHRARRDLGGGFGCGKTRHRGFVQKHRAPFAGGAAVLRRAADELDFAVEVFDEAGRAEDGDGFTVASAQLFEEIFDFHARILAGGVGQNTVQGKK